MSLMESLLNLHRVDSQVRGLRSRLDSAERYLTAQQRQLDELEQQQAELETRKRHHQAKASNYETEAQGLDEQIEKFRRDLNSAATNKQYQAVLAEVDNVKARRAQIDEATLAEMEQIESIDTQLAALTDDHAERIKVRDVAKARREERAAEVGDRLNELETERDRAAADVPEQARQVFDQVADLHDGEAMACVEEISRRHREYACGECHMHMPFEMVSNLMSGTESLVQCTSCRRILYLNEETRGALAPK